MSANVIIFEGQYMADLIRNMNKAQQLTEEAVSIIKKANQHRNWKCMETAEINSKLDIISDRVQRLKTGITDTTLALGNGLRAFRELEQRSENQANTLSGNMRERYGFSASVRGKDGRTNLPVTEVPKVEDNFIVKAIKGTARNVIQGLGTVFGAAIGAISNGINKAGEGFIKDVQDALITPMVNIFQGGYLIGESIKHGRIDEFGEALGKIAINSAGLIGSVVGLGGQFAEKGIKGSLNNWDDITQYIGDLHGEGTNAFNLGNSVGDVMQNPAKAKDAVNELMGMVSDSLVPFNLDKTLAHGIYGVLTGTQSGADIGYKITNTICNFLGL